MTLQPDRQLSSDLSRRLFWRTVPLLFTILALSFMDRAAIGYAALQMNDSLGFGPLTFGIGGSMFFIGYLLAEIPASLAVLRFGAGRAIATMMLLWGSITAAMALVHGADSFYATRFALGLAEAGYGPAMFLYLNQWFPKHERATAIGAVTSASVVAMIIGGPIAGLVLETVHWRGLAPWQWLFVLEGLPTLLLALFVYRNLANRPADAAWMSPSQRSELLTLLALEHSESPPGNLTRGWEAAKDLRVWLFFLIFGFISAGFMGMTVWLPQVVHQLGELQPLEIGLISAIPYLLGAVSMTVVGRLSDRSGARYRYVVSGALAGALGFGASALLAAMPIAAIAALTFGLIGVSSIIGPFWSVVTEFLRGRAAAVGISLVNAGSAVFGFFATLLLGWLRERSGDFMLGLLFLAALSMLGAALMAILGRRAINRQSGYDSTLHQTREATERT